MSSVEIACRYDLWRKVAGAVMLMARPADCC